MITQIPDTGQRKFPGLRVLARHSLLNLLGNVVPLLAAILVIPQVVRGLGTERFGVLSLIWIVIGYFGLFDLGIGRATTKFVAEYLAEGRRDLLSATIWTSLATLAGGGVVGGLVLAGLNRILVLQLLHIPPYLEAETSAAFFVLAASIPVVLASAGVRGILEAYRRFGVINAIKIPVGLATIMAPLLALPYTRSLKHLAAVLLVCRIVEFGAYVLACRSDLVELGRPQRPRLEHLKRLLGFGGWLTVTNILGPLMTYLDRFIVGALLSMSAVAFYATPYDVVTKQGVVPASLLGAVFPSLCGYAAVDSGRFAALYHKALGCLAALLAPFAIVLVLFATPLLNAWLGPVFAAKSSTVVQLLALGVYLNSLAQAPYAAIQALGRPDLTAKLHALEFPFYLALLWFCASRLGITGAALAWLLRVVFDACLLFWIAHRMLAATPRRSAQPAKVVTLPMAAESASEPKRVANHV